MNRVLYNTLMITGFVLGLLGLLTLKETVIGYESTTSLLGLVILIGTLLYNKIDKLEERIKDFA